jgi:hypothetical protein
MVILGVASRATMGVSATGEMFVPAYPVLAELAKRVDLGVMQFAFQSKVVPQFGIAKLVQISPISLGLMNGGNIYS